MKIYCTYCGCSHWFTAKEAEELIYVLEALRADLSDPEVSNDPVSNMECLEEISGYASHPEMLLEHVEANVEARKASVVGSAGTGY